MKKKLIWLIKLNIVLLSFVSILFAQSSTYKIQQNDVLNISFWEHPELNSQVEVDDDGGIELPVIGKVAAEGVTIRGLRRSIISKMAIYNRLVNQLSIKIEEYGQNLVYVTGQVAHPGKYSFEEIPNIWDIILEAGGPLATAMLDKISVVRGDGKGQVIPVNLAGAMQNGRLQELPKIRPRDTISIVGATESGIVPSPLAQSEKIYVLGAVGKPGAHPFESNMNLLEAIGKAGGPTDNADIKKARYIVVENGISRVIDIDLEEYMVNDRKNTVPILRKGSTVFIPHKKQPSPLTLTLITALITTVITTSITVLAR